MKKYNLAFILLIWLLLNLLAGCTPHTDTPTTVTTPSAISPDVYVAGYEINKATGKTVAKYWKNGKQTVLTDGTRNARANSIMVVGNDVYVAGYESSALYWKNGIAIQLTDGSVANSLTVVGNDVYVAGKGSGGNAMYWKNGVGVKLPFLYTFPGTLNSGEATSIAISGSDVYTVGYQDARDSLRPGPVILDAVYWKNTTPLATPGYVSKPIPYKPNLFTSIAISGSDIYLTGINGGSDGFYWKNGNYVSAKNGLVWGKCICISGTDIYVAGNLMNNNSFLLDNTPSAYWKNGDIFYLTDGTYTASPTGITVYGNDVYVSGQENNIAKYWKNGTAVLLTDGSTVLGATGIFVR